MGHSIQQGKKKLYFLFGIHLVISTLLVLINLSIKDSLVTDAIRGFLTLLLFYFVYKGNTIAKNIYVFLMFAAGLLSIVLSINLLITNVVVFSIMILLSSFYIFSSIYVIKSKDINAFLTHQKT